MEAHERHGAAVRWATSWVRAFRIRSRRLRGAIRRRRTRGASGERQAARWLRRHGHRIIARNVRVEGVEIDLLVEAPGGVLAIVEVKRRGTLSALERPVRAGQRARLRRAAQRIARRHPDRTVRIDVVLVLGTLAAPEFVHRRGAIRRHGRP